MAVEKCLRLSCKKAKCGASGMLVCKVSRVEWLGFFGLKTLTCHCSDVLYLSALPSIGHSMSR